MPFAPWDRFITDEAGNLVFGATVEVRREAPGSPLAVLYEDFEGETPLGNSFTLASDSAHAVFHVVGGFYRVDITKDAFSQTLRYQAIGTNAATDAGSLSDAGFAYEFEEATTAPPTAGAFRANNANLSAATKLFISKTTAGGYANGDRLLELEPGGKTVPNALAIVGQLTGGASFNITDVTDQTGYVEIDIDDHDGDTAFAAGIFFVQREISGNDGQDSAQSVNSQTHAASGKAVLHDDDEIPIVDTQASNALKKQTYAQHRDQIIADVGEAFITGFNYAADIEAATIPTGVDLIEIVSAGAVLDAISTPSPVEPWHVQSDNGRYFEMRFPDGRVNIRAFAGDDQGLDATDDTDVIRYACDYVNRAWWEGGGGALAWQLGSVFIPPGIWRVDPTDPIIVFDHLKLIGAGDGQSMIRAHNTSAGSLFQRPSTATYNSSQRTTHTEYRDLRFILTAASQHALGIAHSGRGLVQRCTFTRQDRDDEHGNDNQTPQTSTRGIRLRNSNSTFVGGDIFTIRDNHFYFLDRGIEAGNGSSAPGPEKLRIIDNEVSDCLNPIVVNDYGGAGGQITGNVIQRWAVGNRAIDIVARFGVIRDNYLECLDNTVPPILLRTGCLNMVVHTRSHVNYTAHEAVAGPPQYMSLGSNNGTLCYSELLTELSSTFVGWPVP